MISNFSFKQEISQDAFELFTRLTEDTNPVHFDNLIAKNLGFRAPIVHGMLTASFISKLIGTKLPGPGSVWLSQTINFISPVYLNDVVEITGKLVSYSKLQKVSKISIEIKNQFNEVVLTGTAIVKKSFEDDSQTQKEIVYEKESTNAKSKTIKKSYLITGGTGGIGQAVLHKLVHPNNSINFTYNKDKQAAESLVKEVRSQGGSAQCHYMDLKDQSSISELFSNLESNGEFVSGIAHCSAILPRSKNFESYSSDDLIEEINGDLHGSLQILRHAIHNFKTCGNGSFVNVSTIYTQAAPPMGMYSYIASKTALESVVDGLAFEFGHLGFRFNSILPGMTNSKFLANTPEKSKLVTKAMTPLRKLGSTYEIANLIYFLLGDDSSHITGERYRISGGLR